MSDTNRPEILTENTDEPRRPAQHGEAADSGADSLDAPLLEDGPREENLPRRQKIRSAITSIYAPRRPAEPVAPPPPADTLEEGQPSSISEPDPAALKAEAARLLHAQIDGMVAQAQTAAKDGQIDDALRILSQAVRLDPEHSMAWTWLGGLLVNRNLERAQYCLKRAVELDPDNQAAKRGLEGVEAKLNPTVPLTAPPETEPEAESIPAVRALTVVEDEDAPATEEATETEPELDPNEKSIGATELAVIKPDAPPIAAKIKPAAKGRKRSLILVGAMLGFVLLCGLIGLWFTVAPPYFGPAEPTPTPLPTPVPPTPDELLAQRLRNQIGRYNALLSKSSDLRSRFDKGEVRWDDLRKEYRDLQNSVKDEKKQVDGIVRDLTPRLQPVYRILQNVADIMITATDYRISGLDNTSSEDLNESDRQYALASSLLTDSLRRLNEITPPPTTTAPPSTPTLETAVPTTPGDTTAPTTDTPAPTTVSPTTAAPTTVAPTTTSGP